jgi:uncharacterized membrane protein YciS (DUF1049 family)
MKSLIAFFIGFSLAFLVLGEHLLTQVLALVFTLGFAFAWVFTDLSERHAARQNVEQSK